MQINVIHDLPDWLVTSYGNGLSYELKHKPSGHAVFFQGDDASEFRDELDKLTSGNPCRLDYANALQCIWFDYQECAQ